MSPGSPRKVCLHRRINRKPMIGCSKPWNASIHASRRSQTYCPPPTMTHFSCLPDLLQRGAIHEPASRWYVRWYCKEDGFCWRHRFDFIFARFDVLGRRSANRRLKASAVLQRHFDAVFSKHGTHEVLLSFISRGGGIPPAAR